jgi:hypothetical protein
MKRSPIGAGKCNDRLEPDNHFSDTLKGCQALDSDEELEAALRRLLIELSGTDEHSA